MGKIEKWIWVVGLMVLLPAGYYRGQTNTSLTELEHTKLLLIREQQKNNQAQGQLIYQAHEQNQRDAQTLKNEEQSLIGQICTAHGLTAVTCQVSPDGSTIIAKDPPAKPVPAGGIKK